MRFPTTILATAAAAACLATASRAEESQKVAVQVKVIKCSGERRGIPEFDEDLVGIRSKLDRLFGGYERYSLLEALLKLATLKAPAAFKLQSGPTVTITVTAFEKGRFVADLEIHDGDKRVGGLTVRGKEGSFNYAAVLRKANELIVVAFKVTRPPPAQGN